MKKPLTLILILFATPCFAEEISLFDSEGDPVAYIDTDEENNIYLWEGKPVAYLYENHVYGFNGDHLGWFEKGIIGIMTETL